MPDVATTPSLNVVSSVAELHALEGTHLGHSDWHDVTQQQVEEFADATGDHQWLHVDPERAKAGPFGTTIAHGYLVLSLTPHLLPQVVDFSGFAMVVNYGAEKLRFPAPTPVGSRIRLGAHLESVTEIPGGAQTELTLTFQVEGAAKPSCVVRTVLRQYEEGS